ncbi:MAG: hypothetical protein R2710_04215 [Acidimicrobiales bacterium]
MITGLMLAMAVMTPLGGKLGDIHGRRKVFLIGLFARVCSPHWPQAWRGARFAHRVPRRKHPSMCSAMVIPNAQALMMHAYGPAGHRRLTVPIRHDRCRPSASCWVDLIDLLGWRACS